MKPSIAVHLHIHLSFLKSWLVEITVAKCCCWRTTRELLVFQDLFVELGRAVFVYFVGLVIGAFRWINIEVKWERTVETLGNTDPHMENS